MRTICYKIGRFLLAGGTGAAINLVLLYVFTEWVRLHYLQSAVLAFAIAVTVSFVLQKFWTFADRRLGGWQQQAGVFLMVAIINTGINTAIVYLLVEAVGWHYLVGQIVASGLIALESFFVYQFLIFRSVKTTESIEVLS